MQPIPKEQIIKRIQLLPESLQEAFFSDRTVSAILKNCALRDIPPTNTYFVGVLARRVLIGYLRPESFVAEIQKETGVSEMTARLVAHDIDGEVFSNVRLELKKLYPPVIQTPTVQSWKQESQKTNEPAAKPKYVIPIPEKFMKREVWGIKPEETPKQDSLKTLDVKSDIQEKTIQNQPAQAPIKTELSQPVQTPQTTSMPPLPLKANEAKPTNEAIFKPIVPLPTFIRSQFKMEEPKKAASAENQKTKAKDFVGKFGAPDQTLAKPEASKTDPYKEQIQ